MQYNHGTPISDPLFYNSFLTSLLHTEQVVSTQATINFRWTTASKDTEMEKQCWMSRDKHDGVALGRILRSTLLNKPPARQPCFGGILHLDHLPATARKPSKIPKQGMIDKAEIRKPISEVLPIGIAGPLTLFMTFLLFPLRLSLDWALFFSVALGGDNWVAQICGELGKCWESQPGLDGGKVPRELARGMHPKAHTHLTQSWLPKWNPGPARECAVSHLKRIERVYNCYCNSKIKDFFSCHL